MQVRKGLDMIWNDPSHEQNHVHPFPSSFWDVLSFFLLKIPQAGGSGGSGRRGQSSQTIHVRNTYICPVYDPKLVHLYGWSGHPSPNTGAKELEGVPEPLASKGSICRGRMGFGQAQAPVSNKHGATPSGTALHLQRTGERERHHHPRTAHPTRDGRRGQREWRERLGRNSTEGGGRMCPDGSLSPLGKTEGMG